MTYRKQRTRSKFDISKKEIHEPPKNQQKNRQVSRKKTARAAKPQSGHDSPNKRLGEKIRKMRED